MKEHPITELMLLLWIIITITDKYLSLVSLQCRRKIKYTLFDCIYRSNLNVQNPVTLDLMLPGDDAEKYCFIIFFLHV